MTFNSYFFELEYVVFYPASCISAIVIWRLLFIPFWDISFPGCVTLVYFVMIDYSYASLSLTVSCDALRAGKALAMVARMSVKISHAIIPLIP